MVGCRTGASRRYYHRTRGLSSRGGRGNRYIEEIEGGSGCLGESLELGDETESIIRLLN